MGARHIVDCCCRSTGKYRFSLAVTACFAVAFFAATASAQMMYPEAMLEAKKARIEKNLDFIIRRDIPDATAPAYRAAARRATLDLRTRGFNFLDFHHDGNKVVVPADALQFLDDLGIVQAWLDLSGCDGRLVQNYVFHLVKSERGAIILSPEGKTLSPTDAFGLDRKALLRNKKIDDVSEKYYKSAAWFLLAHEIGHIALGHEGESLQQEIAADDFALDTMRRNHLLPAGIMLYLTAISFGDQAGAARTHPVSAERVRRIASALSRRPQDFVSRDPPSEDPEADRKKVLDISGNFSRIADALTNILGAERSLIDKGWKIEDARKQVFKPVNYKTACPAGRR